MFSFEKKLVERAGKSNLRALSVSENKIDFYSNDYLSLARNNSKLISAAGSTGSRLLSGNSQEAMHCETFLATFFNSESALVFNSGYNANLGFFSALPQRGDTVIYDELIHASVRDGIRLSFAKNYAFKHNDLVDLVAKIKMAQGTVFVAVESLYSMDGDFSLLTEIAEICYKHKVLLVVDEAHSGGIYGNQGKGMCEELGIVHHVFARLITFGKAYGSHGAAVLSSKICTDFLINFSRSFIYTTALSPASYAHIVHQVSFLAKNSLQPVIFEKIAQFRQAFEGYELPSDARSPIQVIPVSGAKKCQKWAEKLQAAGFAVKAIVSPTVREGQERLRICIHVHNEQVEFEGLAKELKSAL